MRARALVPGLVVAAALGLVAVARNKSTPAVLLSGEPIADKITEHALSQMQARQRAADLATVKDAAHVNAVFGGTFSDGVGSNTWAHTPWQKYDNKDAITESLAETASPPLPTQCMALARAFQGKDRRKLVANKAQRAQALRCLHLVEKGGHAAKTHPEARMARTRLAQPLRTHAAGPGPPYPPPGPGWEGVPARNRGPQISQGANKMRHELGPHTGRPKMSKSMKTLFAQTFDDRLGARKRANPKEVKAKVAFWEDIGSEPERLQPSHARSKTVVQSEFKARPQMLLQVSNPYAARWSKLDLHRGLASVNAQISKNLEPLAAEYPFMRAIRH